MRAIYRTTLFSILLLSVIILSSCRNSHRDKLTAAEEIIYQDPDSALKILYGLIPTDDLDEEARHALLTTIAQDLNFATQPSDSLIKLAVDYYPYGSKERMAADYYSGRVNLQNGKYNEAIKSFLDAEEAALRRKDAYHLGLIYHNLAYLFNVVNDDSRELQYSRKSYECFKSIGDSTLVKFAALDYGRALSVGKRTLDEGRALLDSLIAVSQTDDALDMMLRADALRINIGAQILAVFHRQKPKAFDFKNLENHFYDTFPDDFFRDDMPDKGNEHSGALEYPLKSGAVLMTISYPYATEIHRRLNEMRLNLYHLEYEALDSTFQHPDYDRYNDAVPYSASMIEDYLTQRHTALMEKEKAARQKLSIILWCIAAAAIIIIALYIMWRGYTKKRQNRLIIEASELRQLLQSRNRNIRGLQEYINSLYGEKFNMVEELCDMFILPSKQPSEQKRIYDTVKSIVDGFKMDGARRSEIENFVNKYKNNVASNFKKDFPTLPQRDYILFLYCAAGFSRHAISYLMGDNVDVVSNRKTRLRKRFAAFDGDHKSQYIDALK